MSESERRQIDSEGCTGCRACEVACSFHHTRTFLPTRSSIHVSLDRTKGEISITLDPGCDLCTGEKGMLCARFCGPKILNRVKLAGQPEKGEK